MSERGRYEGEMEEGREGQREGGMEVPTSSTALRSALQD